MSFLKNNQFPSFGASMGPGPPQDMFNPMMPGPPNPSMNWPVGPPEMKPNEQFM